MFYGQNGRPVSPACALGHRESQTLLIHEDTRGRLESLEIKLEEGSRHVCEVPDSCLLQYEFLWNCSSLAFCFPK